MAYLDGVGTNKARTFTLLRKLGATKAVLHFSGGNDEGGVDAILLHFPTPEGAEKPLTKDFPVAYYNQEGDEDVELSLLLQAPIDAEYGTWAGEFSAYGTLVWDVQAGTVVMDKYEQSDYDHSSYEI